MRPVYLAYLWLLSTWLDFRYWLREGRKLKGRVLVVHDRGGVRQEARIAKATRRGGVTLDRDIAPPSSGASMEVR